VARVTNAEHRISGAKINDAFSKGADHAGKVASENERKFGRAVMAESHLPIGGVDTRRSHIDDHFSRASDGIRQIAKLNNLGLAKSLDVRGLHYAVIAGKARRVLFAVAAGELHISQDLADALRDAFHADTLQAPRRQNVYFPAEQPLQIYREAEIVVVSWPLEIDQKIEIALSVLSAGGIRTEERNSANRVLLKKLVISAQRAQDALPGEIIFRVLFHCRVRPWCTDVSFRQLRSPESSGTNVP
jgi:hypothetical protein